MKIEAIVNGKQYRTENEGILPGVTLPGGVDEIGTDYGQQVVWIGETAYYVVESPDGTGLYLSKDLMAVDSGDNVVRRITAPQSSHGIGRKDFATPVTVVSGTYEYVVVRS